MIRKLFSTTFLLSFVFVISQNHHFDKLGYSLDKNIVVQKTESSHSFKIDNNSKVIIVLTKVDNSSLLNLDNQQYNIKNNQDEFLKKLDFGIKQILQARNNDSQRLELVYEPKFVPADNINMVFYRFNSILNTRNNKVQKITEDNIVIPNKNASYLITVTVFENTQNLGLKIQAFMDSLKLTN